MKRTILLFSFLSILSLNAQINFQENIIMDEDLVIGGSNFYPADFDGDGFSDVVTTSGVLAWFKNMNGQEFGLPNIVSPFEEGDSYVSAADIDGDGDLDILVASEDNDTVSWYRNEDGLGNFSFRIVISYLTDGAGDVLGADIDGDGDLDVVSASHWDNKIAWYENLDGLGDFGSQQIISTQATWAMDVFVADIDGDLDLDVLSASADDQKIAWYENLNGAGNFGPQQIILSDVEDKSIVFSADIDGDGDMDVLSDYGEDEQIVWHENLDGLGIFSAPIIISTDQIGFSSLYVEDIDGDNDLDVIGSVGSDNKTIWYENLDGTGNFGTQNIISDNAYNSGSVFPVDIDNDNDIDIFNGINTNISWSINTNGQGNFDNQNIISKFIYEPIKLLSADFNNDGALDLLSTSGSGFSKLAWYTNQSGSFNYGSQNIIDTQHYYITQISVGDIDNDNDIDIVAAVNGFDDPDSIYYWYENLDSQGNFSEPILIAEYPYVVMSPMNVTLVDIDQDENLDVLMIQSDGQNVNEISWAKNLDGFGTFGTIQQIQNTLEGIRDAFIEDMDLDGDLDLVCSTPEQGIWLFENLDGLGNFNEGTEIISNSGGFESRLISYHDIDFDGYKDIIATDEIEGKIMWYKNLGALEGFGSENIITTQVAYPNSLGGVDIDSDGDIDVISSSGNDNKVFWHENLDGLGNFGAQQIITEGFNYPKSISFGDYNQDGALDISGMGLRKLALYQSQGVDFNTIFGSIKLDINTNGCDSDDLPMESLMLVSTDGTNSFATFSLPNGFYQFFVDEGSYTTTINSSLPSYYSSNPVSQSSVFTGVGTSSIANFCVEPISTINDLNIVLYPLNEARPGFNASYQIVYENIGTTILSNTIELIFDGSKISLQDASEPITSQTSNSLVFDFVNLNPFETRTIDINFNVATPPTTEIDDVLVFEATINPIIGDNTESDNIFILEQIVVGSFDPNDIQVLEGDEIFLNQTDDFLHYIIRFQNTGTASAINVRVTNELDVNLDWTTMQLENMSHPNRVEITNGSSVEFIFENINLPDSTTNEPESHGYIQYKIKPKNTVDIGDSMSNNANIYFDFNPPILTNTVVTTVVENLSSDDHDINQLSLYPNPTEDILNISSENTIVWVEIYNQLGQVIIHDSNTEGINQIALNQLSAGLYFIHLKDFEGNEAIQKLIKE